MPVTAKLSLKLYEKLGEDVANELVEWFNLVDSTYRADLRELNELNFARSDAKMEQRLAEYDAKLDRRFAQFGAKLDRRFADLEANWERQFAELRIEFHGDIAKAKFDLIKWSVALWVPVALALIGLYLKT